MSSISPIATKDFAARVNEHGCDYLDAPVSGGEVGAKAASLTIMVGGAAEAFERVKPLFELMGKNITLVGGERRRPDGQGRQPDHRRAEHRGGGRGAALRRKAGADPAKVRQALMGGFAASRILEVHGERMISAISSRASASGCTARIWDWRSTPPARWTWRCLTPP